MLTRGATVGRLVHGMPFDLIIIMRVIHFATLGPAGADDLQRDAAKLGEGTYILTVVLADVGERLAAPGALSRRLRSMGVAPSCSRWF